MEDEADFVLGSQEEFRGVDGMLGSQAMPQAQRNGWSSAAGDDADEGFNFKSFCDSVHGTFGLGTYVMKFVDTPQFQRTRRLKQLGLSHYVFPSASHTRFDHSLGVGHLAHKVADRIFRTQGDELELRRRDVHLVTIAGAMHDLGHGPGSHVFENEFLSRIGRKDWHHEEMSIKLLKHMVDVNHIDNFSKEDMDFVADAIRGDVYPGKPQCLFEIVNNKRCGVDVDKVDYLQRDAKQCHVNLGCDFDRLYMFSKVVDNKLAFKSTEYNNLCGLFTARADMYRKVYLHSKTKAVEFMVVDALLEADQALKFSETIDNPADYWRLDDTLFAAIESYGRFGFKMNAELEDDGASAHMERAQAILERLHKRDFYRFGEQAIVPRRDVQSGRWESIAEEFSAENVAACYEGHGTLQLRPEDLRVSQVKIDFTQGSKNPLDSMIWFRRITDTEAWPMSDKQTLGSTPEFFQERVLRVYTRERDPAYQEAASEALQRWCRKHFGSKATVTTPGRALRDGGGAAGAREASMRDADPHQEPAGTPTRATGGAAALGGAAHATEEAAERLKRPRSLAGQYPAAEDD